MFALLRHTRSALFAASVLVGILFAALRLPTELPNGNYTVSGIVLSAEYSDGETELILTKSELHSSASAGIFHREGRVKIITEGYLNIDVGDGVYIPKVYLRGAAKGRFVGTEQIPETAFGGYNGIGKVIRRRFER